MKNKIKQLLREETTPFGSSDKEIVTNISSDIMSHITPAQHFIDKMQQAVENGDAEEAQRWLHKAKEEMRGVADIFDKMQKFLDNQ
jgi:hypothetical protein